jgi:hypothetical protein
MCVFVFFLTCILPCLLGRNLAFMILQDEDEEESVPRHGRRGHVRSIRTSSGSDHRQRQAGGRHDIPRQEPSKQSQADGNVRPNGRRGHHHHNRDSEVTDITTDSNKQRKGFVQAVATEPILSKSVESVTMQRSQVPDSHFRTVKGVHMAPDASQHPNAVSIYLLSLFLRLKAIMYTMLGMFAKFITLLQGHYSQLSSPAPSTLPNVSSSTFRLQSLPEESIGQILLQPSQLQLQSQHQPQAKQPYSSSHPTTSSSLFAASAAATPGAYLQPYLSNSITSSPLSSPPSPAPFTPPASQSFTPFASPQHQTLPSTGDLLNSSQSATSPSSSSQNVLGMNSSSVTSFAQAARAYGHASATPAQDQGLTYAFSQYSGMPGTSTFSSSQQDQSNNNYTSGFDFMGSFYPLVSLPLSRYIQSMLSYICAIGDNFLFPFRQTSLLIHPRTARSSSRQVHQTHFLNQWPNHLRTFTYNHNLNKLIHPHFLRLSTFTALPMPILPHRCMLHARLETQMRGVR